MNFPEFVLTTLGALTALAVVMAFFFAGYAAGARRSQRRIVNNQTQGLAELWRYQRLLNDSARELAGLVEGVSPLTETSRDELLEAREAAYEFADRLPEETRWVVEGPSLPDLADPAVSIEDVSVAYLDMAEAIRTALERRAVERLPEEARRAVLAREWRPHDRVA